jgi:TonB family protein
MVYIFRIVFQSQRLGALLLIGALSMQLHAQSAPMRVGNGVTPPRVAHKREPEYTSYARAQHIQGTVIFRLVVSESGRATDIEVLSPLGFGLDEAAREAIEKWEFIPGQKDGKPVPVLATIEVNFRLGDVFDEEFERRRTKYNLALQDLKRDDPKTKDRAVASILELARQNFPAALYLDGMWELAGDNVPQDPASGMAKIEKAAKKDFGPAIYQIALRALRESAASKRDWSKMRQAAMLGSVEAQFLLGDRHERGDGVKQDVGRAKNYFRLCAARGIMQCQYRLARLLFGESDRRDYEQALAWFGLAADQGSAEAREIVDRESPKLSAAQERSITTFKRQLVGKFD